MEKYQRIKRKYDDLKYKYKSCKNILNNSVSTKIVKNHKKQSPDENDMDVEFNSGMIAPRLDNSNSAGAVAVNDKTSVNENPSMDVEATSSVITATVVNNENAVNEAPTNQPQDGQAQGEGIPAGGAPLEVMIDTITARNHSVVREKCPFRQHPPSPYFEVPSRIGQNPLRNLRRKPTFVPLSVLVSFQDQRVTFTKINEFWNTIVSEGKIRPKEAKETVILFMQGDASKVTKTAIENRWDTALIPVFRREWRLVKEDLKMLAKIRYKGVIELLAK